MRLISTLIYTCIISTVIAQKQTAIWYFGANAGLDFNSGSPVSINNGQLNTHEGCSAISDPNGNLIMYTDGITVWDKTHAIMPNGNNLLGDPSSAQSGIIVPKPGNAQIYYIFTSAIDGSTDGIRYSVVDLSLNGGNGDVTATKNIFLVGPSSEKLTAVRHANGTDIWVVIQKDGTNQFYAFLVSATGVNITPVISAVGTANIPSGGGDGCLKTSPDGTKLVNVHLFPELVELYNFNANTGVVSSPIAILSFPSEYPYGVEFSPNSQILYVSTGFSICQFDVSSGNNATIQASKVIIAPPNNFFYPGQIQLALDGKIYISILNSNFLGVINNPDLAGTSCNFNASGINISPSYSKIGLPQFITSSFLNSAFTCVDLCFGDSTHFTLAVNPTPDSILWNFGVSGTTLDSSTLLNPAFLFPDTGEYIITLYSWLNNLADTAIDTIHIYGKFLNPMDDLPICNGGNALFDATHPGASYLWSNNSTNATLSVNSPGIYWVDVTMNGCTFRDSVQANLVVFSFSLGNDTTLCPNTSIVKTLNVPNANYFWNSTNTSSSELMAQAGIFWVNVSVLGCTKRDSIVITYFPDLLFIGNDTVLCFDTSLVTLSSNISGTDYLWNTGATTPIIIAYPDSFYILQVTDANACVLKDTIRVSFNTPSLFLGDDVLACVGEYFTLSVYNSEFTQYSWNTGQISSSISIHQTGIYDVLAKDVNGCFARDTIAFDFTGCSLYVPSAFTPNEDAHNPLFKATGENIIDFNLKIYNRWGQKVFEATNINQGWDGTYQGSEAPIGVYVYMIEYRDAINLKFKRKTESLVLIR